MLKKLIKTALVGAALLALAGTAKAATIEINFYGASAQYTYWNDAADNFLEAAPRNCNPANVVQKQSSDKKHGVTYTTAACGDGNNYIIRYSSKASYDGICAAKGLAASYCSSACSGDRHTRNMFDETQADGCDPTLPNCLKCVPVNMGASDVAGEAFIQQSHGQLYGPNGGGNVDRVYSGVDASGLSFKNPLVVPFGFFAHDSVKKTRCIAPDPLTPAGATGDKAISSWGNQCYDPQSTGHSTSCIGYYKCIANKCVGGVNKGSACNHVTDCPDVALADTKCASIPLDNVSRLMVTMIFNGQALSWTDFGDWYPGLPIVACLRHAGSGTHATLDLGVMRGNGWGWPLLTQESAPTVYFNDGSADEMKCINQLQGAIGYADADQLYAASSKDTQTPFPYENVHALKYQGVEPKRAKIRNGEYEFWSKQWVYYNGNDPNLTTINAILAYAANPANVPSTKADYWATYDEMHYMKATDFTYPGYQDAAKPQLP